jgi:cytidylate kinase
MPENLFIPSVDARIGALEEYNRRRMVKGTQMAARPMPAAPPCITLSREFGCEGYPVAERLCAIMQRRTGLPWLLIDREVLDEVSRRHNISREVLEGLGEKNRVLTDVLATFSPRWKTDNEYFQMLCSHVLSLAAQGNVIILELGGALITRSLERVYNFRIYGTLRFKVDSIATRLCMTGEEAEQLIRSRQRLRDRFMSDFLGQDGHDPTLYDMMFNNTTMSPDQIATAIADRVLQPEPNRGG